MVELEQYHDRGRRAACAPPLSRRRKTDAAELRELAR
jgi:hypothetical protein